MTKVLTEPEATESPLSLYAKKNDGKKRVLFVCTGNTCRSPMCAAAVNGLSPYKERFFAFSAGLSPLPGAPITGKAVQALKDAGILPSPDNDYPSHRARAVREADLAACDLAVGLTKAHAFRLAMEFPAYAGKIYAFSEDIPDPYGGDGKDYAACLSDILRGVAALPGIGENDGTDSDTVGDTDSDTDGEKDGGGKDEPSAGDPL